jgi:hypothetical protein
MGEVAAFEAAIGAAGFIEHQICGSMPFSSASQVRGWTIGRVRHEPMRQLPKRNFARSIILRCAVALACRTDVVASTVPTDALCDLLLY